MKRKDVNLKLMPEAFAKFTAWCRRHGYTKQTKLALMVDDLVAGEKLDPAALLAAQKPQTTPPPQRTPVYEEEPFEAMRHYEDLLGDHWIPDAIAETHRECADRGITGWIPSKPRAPAWLNDYRKRCEAAGRNYDEDMRVFE